MEKNIQQQHLKKSEEIRGASIRIKIRAFKNYFQDEVFILRIKKKRASLQNNVWAFQSICCNKSLNKLGRHPFTYIGVTNQFHSVGPCKTPKMTIPPLTLVLALF
jgi:hypothetical protein